MVNMKERKGSRMRLIHMNRRGCEGELVGHPGPWLVSMVRAMDQWHLRFSSLRPPTPSTPTPIHPPTSFSSSFLAWGPSFVR